MVTRTRGTPSRFFIEVIYLLYSIVQIAAFPLVLLYLLYRGLKDRRYFHHLSERFGRLSGSFHRTTPGAIWLHAVSVGEILSSIQLVKDLGAASPHSRIYVSTATLAGRALAEEKLNSLVSGVFYAPIDFRFAVRRVLRALRPALVVVLETEIWPNLYREAKRSGAALAVVNGRISDRTIATYRRMAWFFQAALTQPDSIWVQSARDRERYLELGAPTDRLHETGNLKFDFNPAARPVPEDLNDWLRTEGGTIWIAASTMPPRLDSDPDEDAVVIDAFREISARYPKLLLILVPRRPERFDAAASRLEQAGIRFARRSNLHPVELPGVLLLDSMGELSSLFELAQVVFMGGTLAQRGGHNILEPAYFAKPVIVGPHMENFAAIHAEFRDAGALVEIGGPSELAGAVARLLDDAGARTDLGRRGNLVAGAQRGVAAKIARELLDLHALAVPRSLHSPLAWGTLWPLAKLWGAFARKPDGAQSLSTPVISIGGITMGGTGKTPMAIWLADRLKARGVQPAILTRGYGRQSPHQEVIVQAGHAAPIELTGDEAQIFIRRGIAHLGIDSDRYRAGVKLEQTLAPGVFLLDDGFQHRKLKRDVDLVLVDSLDPFGGGDVFPLGRLREPLENLARATAFVLTRATPGRRTDGIERILRQHNATAPVFRSWVVPSKWRGGTPAGRVAAFCGLANPNTFWKALEESGLEVVARWIFEDHHKYSCLEARRLGYQAGHAGVEFLVTTEKDYMNLPEGALKTLDKVKLCWLEVDVRFEDEQRILDYVSGITIDTQEGMHKSL